MTKSPVLKMQEARPTRIITYAWGDKYFEYLMSLVIPSLLAPGNLPYVAKVVPCELVILTEERFFSAVDAHPAIKRVKEHCQVRLIALDDLISVKDKYGMALTYALHRGFSDLGPMMTETWQIFLNADFILADGCLQNLLKHLGAGERLVASPSYCANSADVLPELQKHYDPETFSLSVSPRDLARLALQHRHNTIRGKTVNQRHFNIRYMDQFYWHVDDDTLIGHQMPIAIVGLRPERHISEPNAYWDHGIMKEFCPNAQPCVLGDSDEFLMLELRDADVAQDQISLTWPTSAEIVERMMLFLTPYQRDFVAYPLTLHSAALAPAVTDARLQLSAFVDDTLSLLPEILPSHIDHPQWDYHRPGFVAAQHSYLSKRLGSLTETASPPATASKLDTAWWRLDGANKRYLRARQNITDGMQRATRLAKRALEGRVDEGCKEIDASFLGAIAAENRTTASSLSYPTVLLLEKGNTDDRPSSEPSENVQEAADRYEAEYELVRKNLIRDEVTLERVTAAIQARHIERLEALDHDFSVELEQLEREYRQSLPVPIASAGVMNFKTSSGPLNPNEGPAIPIKDLIRHRSGRVVRGIYDKLIGRFPQVTMLNGYWASVRHVRKAIDDISEVGAQHVLELASDSASITPLGSYLPGAHVRVTAAQLGSSNFKAAALNLPKFDLCLCDLNFQQLGQFSRLCNGIVPYMRPGGTIIGFYLNSGVESPAVETTVKQGLLGFSEVAQVYYAGSAQSTRAIARLDRAAFELRNKGLTALPQLAFCVLASSVSAFFANRAQSRVSIESASKRPAICESVTLKVTVKGAA